jgi:hypothetical protein
MAKIPEGHEDFNKIPTQEELEVLGKREESVDPDELKEFTDEQEEKDTDTLGQLYDDRKKAA